jgi:hypothetical protein
MDARRPATAVLRFVTAGRPMEVWLVRVDRPTGAALSLSRRIVGAQYGDVVEVSAAEVMAAGRRVMADSHDGRTTPEWIRLVAEL